MQTHITPNNKLASLGTVGLLFLAGIAGMVFLLPASPVHAASPTVTLSKTSGTVGSWVTITGTGFTPSADVGIEFGTTLINTFGTSANYPTVASLIDTSTTYQSSPTPLSSPACSTTNPCIRTDANGWFQAIIAVPPTVNGAQTVTVSDGTLVGTTTFTVNAAITLTETDSFLVPLTSGFPDENFPSYYAIATGFAASDSVSFTAAVFGGPNGATSTPIDATPDAGVAYTSPTQATVTGETTSGVIYLSGPGVAYSTAPSLTVSDVLGGTQTILGTGTSTLTASTTFTIEPVIAFYSTQSGGTTYTMGAAPNQATFIAGWGFAAGTIAADTITVSGTAVSQKAETVTSTGNFGVGAGNHLFLYSGSAGLTQGQASIVIVDGTNTYTFNFANHNIVAPSTTDSTGTTDIPLIWNAPGYCTTTICGYSEATNFAEAGSAFPDGLGYPFIVSTQGGSGTVASGTLASSSYEPNSGTQVAMFGNGFNTAPTSIPTITPTGGSGLSFVVTALTLSNGAFWLVGGGTSTTGCITQSTNAGTTDCLGEEPYPVSPATNYPITINGGGVAAVQNPALTIQPWVYFSDSTLSFGSAPPTATFHGFTAGNVCTLSSGTTTITFTTSCTVGANGEEEVTTGTSSGSATPNLPGGTDALTSSDGIVTGAATSVYVVPASIYGGSSTTTSLSSNSGSSGSTTILRTGTTYGIHGLLPNTGYVVVIDPGQTTQATLGTFTSTSTGGIPAPGVQMTVPSGSSGLHIIGLETASGSYAFFNALGSAPPYTTVATGSSNSPDASNNEAGSLSTFGQYGDNVFNLGASLTAVPTVATVGSSLGISGSGLPASTTFEFGISMAGTNNANSPSSSNAPSTCTIGTAPTDAVAPSVVLGSFTSSSTGTVPASTSVSITDMPTIVGLEQGTLYCVFAQTASGFGSTSATGTAKFLLQASGSLNMTSAPIGHNVVISAHALAASTGYNVLFAPYTNNAGDVVGTIVGAVLTNSHGAGSATFTVPTVISTSTGSQPVVAGTTYNIELEGVSSTTAALALAPTIGVGTISTSCNTTSCISVVGTPAQSTQGVYTGISSSFTNNSNAPVTAVAYAVVHNALGQTVDISTATISAAAGASTTAFNVLFGLAPGTYSVSIFVTSSSGTAISTTSTVSVTIA